MPLSPSLVLRENAKERDSDIDFHFFISAAQANRTHLCRFSVRVSTVRVPLPESSPPPPLLPTSCAPQAPKATATRRVQARAGHNRAAAAAVPSATPNCEGGRLRGSSRRGQGGPVGGRKRGWCSSEVSQAGPIQSSWHTHTCVPIRVSAARRGAISGGGLARLRGIRKMLIRRGSRRRNRRRRSPRQGPWARARASRWLKYGPRSCSLP